MFKPRSDKKKKGGFLSKFPFHSTSQKTDPIPESKSIGFLYVQETGWKSLTRLLEKSVALAQSGYQIHSSFDCPTKIDGNDNSSLDKIHKFINKCSVIVALITKDCTSYAGFMKGIEYAANNYKQIIPVHDPLSCTFPDLQTFPLSIQSAFERPIKLLAEYPDGCWDKILKRCKKTELSVSLSSNNIFLCASKAGRGIALTLSQHLQKEDLVVVVDAKEEFVSQDLEKIIKKTLTFVLVVSDGTFQDPWVLKAFQFAVAADRAAMVLVSDYDYQLPALPAAWQPYQSVIDWSSRFMFEPSYAIDCANLIMKTTTKQIDLMQLPVVPYAGDIENSFTLSSYAHYPDYVARNDFFFHTQDEDGAWFLLQLEKPTFIVHLEIDNRRDGCQERLPPSLVSILDGNDNVVESFKITEVKPTYKWKNINCVGGKIKVQLLRRTALHFAAIRIYQLDYWKIIRQIWIAKKKNSPQTCVLARAPSEILLYICHLVVDTY